MQKKATELLERLRRSTAKPAMTVDHIRALIDEYQTLGQERFFEEVKNIISPQKTRSVAKSKDPFVKTLEGLRERTGFKTPEFVDKVLDQIVADFSATKKPSKKDRSLPKLVSYYQANIGTQKLEAAALKVAEKHSRVH